MSNDGLNISKNETFTWLQPGAWRKPCIVHVTMVANARQPLFGSLAYSGTEAVVEKTPIGWVLINEEHRMLDLCPEVKILADKVMPDHHHMVLQVQRTMPRSILLLLEPDEGAFVQPAVLLATKEALRRKAEERHLCYTDVPVDTKRYRFMALNEMGRLMVGADGICG